jgi:hypothetical protein
MPSQCAKCGATSYASTLFCQSCGEVLTSTGDLTAIHERPSTNDWYGATPPPQPNPQPPQMPMAYPPQQTVYVAANPYACRYCGSPYPPQVVRKLSTVGWFVLFFGLLFCLVGALLAYAFMEDRRICPSCGSTLN